MTRLVLNGPLVGEQQTGSAVYVVQLIRAVLQQRPELEIVARHSTRTGPDANRRSAARIAPRVRAKTTPVPISVLRSAQARLRFPPERLLLGHYDVYHQLHTDADPAVPDEKLVVTLHDTVALQWPEQEGRMYKGAGHLLRRAAAVVTGSNFSKGEICSAFHVAPEHVHVAPYGVDHARYQPPTPQSIGPSTARSPYLLFVGGHTPRKNVERLIDAFSRIRTDLRRDDLTFVLTGPVVAHERELRLGAPSSLPAHSLVFSGYVTDEEVTALYQHAEALIFASLYEGFGLPILEAMACGTPVVTSDGSACAEVAGDAGVLVDPLDVDSIADGTAMVLQESAEQRADRVRLGTDHCRNFTWQRAAKDTLAIYDAVAGRTGR